MSNPPSPPPSTSLPDRPSARPRPRRLRAAGLLLLLLIVPGRAGTPELGPIVDPPPMPMPAYLETARDPAFGTALRRVTEPGRPMAGGRCGPAYCTHRYSSAQAWNADQSLFVVANGCAGLCFLDGRTYRPLFHRPASDACEWHPRDPAAMICVSARAVYLWAPQTNRVLSATHLRGFQRAEFGPYKGNPSASGERVVVRARDADGRLVAFAVDLARGELLPPIALEALPGRNNACTIAASGRYIVCMQDLPEERETLYVFTAEGAPVQAWTEHHRPGHGDLTTDPDGEDVYVGVSKSEPDRFHVIKRRLRDGRVTDLLPYGQISHASLRNTGRPGWVFLSFTGRREDVEGTPRNGKASFFQEVVALRIDGSGALRRLVQTRNAPADYWSETHASPSPDGTQVVFSSNWGRPGGPVSDYVATVAWPETGRETGPPGPAPARDTALR
jgi:hypothetical protein